MIEYVWLERDNPSPERMLGMLEQQFPPRRLKLTKKRKERKLRLFGCACCRRMWRLFVTPESQVVVSLAERYADGEVGYRELRKAWELASAPRPPAPRPWQPIYGAYDLAE